MELPGLILELTLESGINMGGPKQAASVFTATHNYCHPTAAVSWTTSVCFLD